MLEAGNTLPKRRARRWGPVIIIAICAPALWRVALAQTTAPVKPAGNLLYGEAPGLGNLNPYAGVSRTGVTDRVLSMIYEPLFRFNFATEAWENVLAQQLTVVPPTNRLAKMAVAIDLKKGVKWHDGSAFTARDVKFTYDYIRQAGSNKHLSAYFSAVLADVRVESETRVVFEFSSAVADARYYLDDWIIPSKRFHSPDFAPTSPEADLNQNPLGTGPYQYQTFAGRGVVLAVNEGYYGVRGSIDHIQSRVYTDDATKVNGLIGGGGANGVNLLVEVAPEFLPQIDGAGPGFTVEQLDGYNVYAIAMRQNPGSPLEKESVRQALTMAINRQQILKNWFGGHGTVLATPVVPSAPIWDASVTELPFDPTAARAAIKAAGAEGATLRLVFERGASGQDTRTENIVLSVQQELEAVGLKVKTQVLDADAFTRTLMTQGDFDLAFVRWEFNPAYDVSPLLNSRNAGPGGFNYMNFKDPAVDRILDEYEAEGDPSRRIGLMHQLQRLLKTKAPAICLVNEEKSYARRSNYLFPSGTVDPFFFFTYANLWRVR